MYEAKKAELLADIKATDIDRAWFNDTPQGSHVTAEGEELSHLSTFNKTARETFDPVGTPSARLAELERNISYYWKAWLDEIYSAFGLEN